MIVIGAGQGRNTSRLVRFLSRRRGFVGRSAVRYDSWRNRRTGRGVFSSFKK